MPDPLSASQKPVLPAKMYLRRKEVLVAVGGAAQLENLERAGRLIPITLPGYKLHHYTRAGVQAVLDAMWPNP